VTVCQLSKVEPQPLANKPGLRNAVCNLPPRTSKWDRTQRRRFTFAAQN
jgi:hypothetical protein